MRLLADTQILIWSAYDSPRLRSSARALLADAGNELLFSTASILEIAIKISMGRLASVSDARLFRRMLIASGYTEVEVTGDHACGVADLPLIHRDPFDRLLAAQARLEGALLVTNDATLARYPVPVRLV